MLYPIFALGWSIILCLDFALCTFLAYTCSFLPKAWLKPWYNKLFRLWCWSFLRALGVDLKLHQKYQGKLPEQYIVIGNHPSACEDIGMPALFDVSFLAKIEVKSWWILGRISDAAGTYYVKRDSKVSRNAAGEALKLALSSGQSIGLYPEGGCKGRRIHLPFQYGTFDISLQTGIPIVPVLLHYEAQESFEWGPNESLLTKIWAMRSSHNRTANYYVFDPIDPKLFKSKEELTQHVQDLYLTLQEKYFK